MKIILPKSIIRTAGSALWIVLSLIHIYGSTIQPDPGHPGASYTNYHDSAGPWSIHVVKIDRSTTAFEIRSLHALDRTVGLESLSAQLRRIKPAEGIAIAGLNGDFYQRDRAFAGDPRGLQIADGELISAPVGGISFWIDSHNQPHIGAVSSKLRIVTKNSISIPFGLNETPSTNLLQLCTSDFSPSNHMAGARQFALELPVISRKHFEIGRFYSAQLKEIHNQGNGSLDPGTIVLSVPQPWLKNFDSTGAGSRVGISTKTSPDLQEAKMAISGGPILVKAGKSQKIVPPKGDDYEFTTMLERHPRSAIGWNDHDYFLVEVDGRQKESAGMTLTEFAQYLERLGCQEAMNLDGGGSATIWFEGSVRNHPCDGFERPIANSIAVVHLSRNAVTH